MWFLYLPPVAFWLWMLVDSWRRAEFPPLFGSETLAKVVWRGSFFFFNPLLTAMYAGAVRWDTVPGPSKMRAIVLGVGFSLSSVLQLGLISGVTNGPFVLANGEHAPMTRVFGASIRATWATQSSDVRTHRQDRWGLLPAVQRRVRVECASDHPAVILAAQGLTEDIAALPFVESVEYRPFGAGEGQIGEHGPGVFVVLAAPNLSGFALPIYQQVSGTVQLTLGRRPLVHPSIPSASWSYPAAHRQLQGTMHLEFGGIGAALGAGLHTDVASRIRVWAYQAVCDDLRDAHRELGTVRELPGIQTYEQTPSISFIEGLSVTVIDSESSPFVHNRTRWQVDHDQPIESLIEEMATELTSAGWTQRLRGGESGASVLILRRGEEALTLAGWPPFEREEVPVMLMYEKYYSATDLADLAAVSLDGGASPNVLRLFFDHIERPRRAEFRAAVRAGANGGSRTARALWLTLARHAHNDGETEEARRDLRIGLLVARVAGGQDATAKAIKRLAKELDVEHPEVTVETLAEIGYGRLEKGRKCRRTTWLGDPLAFVLSDGDGQPVRLYLKPTDDRGSSLSFTWDVYREATMTSSSGSFWLDPQREFHKVEQNWDGVRFVVSGQVPPGGEMTLTLELR